MNQRRFVVMTYTASFFQLMNSKDEQFAHKLLTGDMDFARHGYHVQWISLLTNEILLRKQMNFLIPS